MLGVPLLYSSTDSSKDNLFRQLVNGIRDYAILVLDPDGKVLTWNQGAETLTGYTSHEILGIHFSRFYLPEAIQSGLPAQELTIAEKEGRFAGESWHIRKDGSTFWASVIVTPLCDSSDHLCGFAKVTQDITERREAEERINRLNGDLHRISARLLHVQDEERRRIARELHDDLGQQLAALKMFVDHSGDQEASKLADSALAYVRNLSYLLHPPLLDETGLSGALSWFVDGLAKRSSIRIELKIRPDEFPRLGRDIEIAVFRVIQESLTNVFRHANANRVSVELEKQTGHVVVRIRDDGKGLQSAVIVADESRIVGVGIAGMRERIRQFGGNLLISRCEPGTLVEATLPINTPDQFAPIASDSPETM
jgi:PAS domain S-box-containing protein